MNHQALEKERPPKEMAVARKIKIGRRRAEGENVSKCADDLVKNETDLLVRQKEAHSVPRESDPGDTGPAGDSE